MQTGPDDVGAFQPPAAKPTARQAAAVAAALASLRHALPPDDRGVLNVCASTSSAKTLSPRCAALAAAHHTPCVEVPLHEGCFMLRLEAGAVALDKKESEAFLACFGPDGQVRLWPAWKAAALTPSMHANRA